MRALRVRLPVCRAASLSKILPSGERRYSVGIAHSIPYGSTQRLSGFSQSGVDRTAVGDSAVELTSELEPRVFRDLAGWWTAGIPC